MNKTIYISGPITDNKTGQPRKGWQKDFLDAEEKLLGMGFNVISPITLAQIAREKWKGRVNDEPNIPTEVPRWYYISECLFTLEGRIDLMYSYGEDALAGIYLIGDPEDIQQSYGTMCEINFALSAGLPVWSQYYHGYAVDNLLRQKTNVPTIAEICKV